MDIARMFLNVTQAQVGILSRGRGDFGDLQNLEILTPKLLSIVYLLMNVASEEVFKRNMQLLPPPLTEFLHPPLFDYKLDPTVLLLISPTWYLPITFDKTLNIICELFLTFISTVAHMVWNVTYFVLEKVFFISTSIIN